MREYRKRKRAVHMSEPLERTPSASTEGARDPWPPIIRKPAPQTKAPDAKLGRRGAIGALKRLWTSRSPFPSGSSLRRCARIATTLATVHPAHGVAIVEVVSGDGVLRSMHYERTPRFRKVKLSWRCPRCDSGWLTSASKRAGLNHGSLTLGER